jgi:hypothetical protein
VPGSAVEKDETGIEVHPRGRHAVGSLCDRARSMDPIGAREAGRADHGLAAPVAIERDLLQLGAERARLPQRHRREVGHYRRSRCLDDHALGLQETEARHILDRHRICRDVEPRRLAVARCDHQKVGVDRI